MFTLKLIKADGSFLGVYTSLDACLKRLQALNDSRGAGYQVRARGEAPAIPKTYTGAVMTVAALITELS